jgi:outer membrane receptor protein involved in Fe transport
MNPNGTVMKRSVLPLLLVIALIFGLACETALAQRSAGTINGTVRDDQSPVEPNVQAWLVEQSTGATVERVTVGGDGGFVFRDVPFARYWVNIVLDSSILATREVAVSSAIPVTLEITNLHEHIFPGVTVEAQRYTPDRNRTGTSKIFTAASIRDLPAPSGAKKIEQVLLSTPGVVPDEDGRLHVRGEDAQLQYVIDGIPVTENMTRVYSSLFNAQLIKSVDVQTGGLNAEYGVAAAGVLAVTTKSGFDAPYFANASAGYGSFGTREVSADIGGNLWGSMAGYFATNISQSDRYLDPIAAGDPLNDHGSSRNFFGKLNGVIGDHFDFNLLGNYGATAFSVPNSILKTPAQDQKQELENYLIGGRINAYLGESSALSLLGYRRHSHATVTSGGLTRISSAADSLRALSENEKFFIGADRTNDATGGQIEYTTEFDWLSAHHNLKGGVGGESYPISEFFTFAVTNPALSNPDSSGGDARYRPYDISQGGTPFLVDASRTGQRYSAYLQDKVIFDKWTVNAGLRFDHFRLLDSETAVSPRLGISYAWNDDLVLRASYNRVVMQAPVEYILVSSSPQARMLTGAEQGSVPTSVRSEKANNFEIGGSYRLNDYLSFDLVGYGKLIDDFIVKVELGNSGIIFPVNLKNGLVAGGELRAELHNWNNLSGFLSVGGGAALGLKPDDGSSPIAAGLILGEEGENYSHPFAGEDAFPTEHNQMLTAALNLTYSHPSGLFGTLGGRFDSGLPFDLVGSNGVGLDPEQSRAELRRRGYSDSVIDLLSLESERPGSPDKAVAPHAIFDLAAGFDFRALTGLRARLALSALNVLDTPYLYKFESSFGGTHFGTPRMLVAQVQVGI